MKKRIVYIFLLTLALLLITVYSLNRFNRNKITAQFEKITMAEGDTIRSLIEASGQHLAESGEEGFIDFLERLYENESIVYIGLFREDQLVYLLSRFEGYFPIATEQPRREYRIFDSPVGKIFEITGTFRGSGNPGEEFRLHIGFNYEFLSLFETASGNNFLLVAGLLSLLTLVLIGLAFYFDKKFYDKELELVKEKQEKERFKELSVLTSEIAHEIKNPLNSIYLSFNVLEKYCSPQPEAEEYREAIKGEIKRISGIIESYSGLSKKVHTNIEPVDMAEFARGFGVLVQEELEAEHIDLKMESDNAGIFYTDRNLLKQVLLNLFKNALEAGASSIVISVTTGETGLILEVRDNGKGIDAGMRETIFKPYTSTKTKGMGLGLHITYRLVRALRGEIKIVESAPGLTVFRVTLPEYTDHDKRDKHGR